MAVRNFTEVYRTALDDAGQPADSSHGWEETLPDIPEALAALYRLAARHPLNQAHNRLLLPDELEVQGQRTIFAKENQEAVVWAYETSEASADPPVWQGHPDGRKGSISAWYPEDATVSEFMVSMWRWLAEPDSRRQS